MQGSVGGRQSLPSPRPSILSPSRGNYTPVLSWSPVPSPHPRAVAVTSSASQKHHPHDQGWAGEARRGIQHLLPEPD